MKRSYFVFYFFVFTAAISFLLLIYGLLQMNQPAKPDDLVLISPDQIRYQWNDSIPIEQKWSPSPEKTSDLGQTLWIKIDAPSRSWKDPRLVIYPSVPEVTIHSGGTTEVYASNPYGHDPRFVIEWSSIPLSTHVDIGKSLLLSVERPGALPYAFEIGEQASIVQYMFVNDLKLVVSFMIMLFLGIAALGLFIVYPRERLYFILSLFTWCMSFQFLVRSNSKHLLYFSPPFYHYLGLVGAIGWPLFSLLFLESIVHPSYRTFIRRLWQGYAALSAVVVTIIRLRPDMFLLFEEGIMVMVIQAIWLSVVVVLVLSIRKKPENMEYAFFLFGYTVYFVDLAYSIAFSYQNGGIASSLALALAFTAIMIRRYWLTQKEIVSLNNSLENKVKERTQELERTHKQLVHSIRESSRVMSEMSALEERNRIAQEMHDVVGHTLTTSIVQLEAGKLFLAKDAEKAKRNIETAEELVRKGLDDIRRSVRMLKDEDWSENITVLLRRVAQETEVLANAQIVDRIEEGLELNSAYKNLFYYAFIEGLSNGIRHSKSKRFEVSLMRINNELTFRLISEGIPYEDRPFGFGLQTMKEKTRRLGGRMELRPSSDVPGAVLEIVLPAEI